MELLLRIWWEVTITSIVFGTITFIVFQLLNKIFDIIIKKRTNGKQND